MRSSSTEVASESGLMRAIRISRSLTCKSGPVVTRKNATPSNDRHGSGRSFVAQERLWKRRQRHDEGEPGSQSVHEPHVRGQQVAPLALGHSDVKAVVDAH